MKRYSAAVDPFRPPRENTPSLQPRVIRREVTPLVFPIDLDSDVGMPVHAEADSSIDSLGPSTPVDYVSLDLLWADVRRSKERILAASPPKVRSLDVGPSDASADTAYLPPRPKIKRRRSVVEMRESPDGRTITAVFDVVGVKKDDMHISYQANRLAITWRTLKVTEKIEDGVLIREREEHHFHRTIPLPLGTKFNEVRASKETGHLSITYPNSRIMRVDPL